MTFTLKSAIKVIAQSRRACRPTCLVGLRLPLASRLSICYFTNSLCHYLYHRKLADQPTERIAAASDVYGNDYTCPPTGRRIFIDLPRRRGTSSILSGRSTQPCSRPRSCHIFGRYYLLVSTGNQWQNLVE